MATTVTLQATAYSTTNVATVTNPSNAYTDTTSTTYASVTTTSNSASKAYFYGFDFSQIPSNAENISFICKIKVSLGVGSTGSAYNVCLANRSSGDALSATTATTTTATVVTLTPTSATWSDIVALGNNFAFCINHQRTNRTHYVYGMEIDVTYTLPVPNKVTFNGNTLIDLTGDDVTAADVLSGVLFHLPSGEQGTGTLVPSSGGLEYESGSFTPTSNVRQPTISFSNTHDTPPSLIAMWWASSGTASSSPAFFLGFVNSTWGDTPYTKGLHSFFYYGSSGSLSNYTGEIQYDGSNSYGGMETYWRFWATETAMTPQTNSSSYLWRKDFLYHWIAIWSQPLFT